jgi:hypothetical protein
MRLPLLAHVSSRCVAEFGRYARDGAAAWEAFVVSRFDAVQHGM